MIDCLSKKYVDICPYHFTQYIINKVDVVLCPYNYVINPKLRKSIGLNVKEAIIVFDEAHNIEDQAEDNLSLDVSYADLAFTHKTMDGFPTLRQII